MNMSALAREMLNLDESFWSLSQNAASTVITALWQGAIIAAGLATCLKIAPRTSAALRFTIWMCGFLVLAALPLLPHLGAMQVSTGLEARTGMAHPWLLLDVRWSALIAIVWLAASLYRGIDLAVHVVRLRGLWKRAIPFTVAGLQFTITRRFWGERRVQLCTTTDLERPSVIGFFAPRILIPAWLVDQLSSAELDQIVLHETEHLRRGDDWTNLLQKLALIVFPLNPMLAWIERRLCQEREMACDEGVIRRTHAPRAYAACLATLAERGLEHRAPATALGALSLGAWQRRPELVKRVHSILLSRQRLGPWATRGVFAAMSCGLLVGSVALSRCPQVIGFIPAPSSVLAESSLAAASSPEASSNVKLLAANESRRNLESAAKALPISAPVKRSASKPSHSGNATGQQWAQRSTAPQGQEFIRVVDVDARQPQTWILLATWEQSEAGPVGAVSDSASVDQPARPASGQVMLHVMPKNFVFPTLAAVPTRTGWYIIQL